LDVATGVDRGVLALIEFLLEAVATADPYFQRTHEINDSENINNKAHAGSQQIHGVYSRNDIF
jgi:hypothetical protein